MKKSNYGKIKDTDGKTISEYSSKNNSRRKQNNVSGQGIDSSTNKNAKRYTTPGTQQSDHIRNLEAKEQKKKTKESTRIWTKELGWHTPSGRGPDKKPRKKKIQKSEFDEMLELLEKAKKYPIGTVRNGRKKVAEGKWVSANESGTGSIQEAKPEDSKPTIKDMTIEEHRNAASEHYDKALEATERFQAIQDKIKTHMRVNKQYKLPPEAEEKMAQIKAKINFHKEQYREHTKRSNQNWKSGKKPTQLANKYTSQRAKQAQDKVDQKKNTDKMNKSYSDLSKILKAKVKSASGKEWTIDKFDPFKRVYNVIDSEGNKAFLGPDKQYEILNTGKMNKSILSVDHQGGAIETANYALDRSEAPQEWIETIQNIMQGFEYGSEPREISLTHPYSAILTKVDDGLYSGYVKNDEDWKMDSDSNGSPTRIEKQTIPSIIQWCIAKEYIKPIDQYKELNEKLQQVEMADEAREELETESNITVGSILTENPIKDNYLAHKLVDLLNKLV